MTQTPPVDEVRIAEAVRVLEAGGLVAMPTETVYGLAADADNESAVLSTYAAKGRPADHPLIVHVAGIDAISHWAEDVPPEAWLLAKKYWPGPLTLVLKKKARCGLWVTGGQDTVALRCPSHPWAHALISAFSGPTWRGLTAPSANTFGRISPSCAAHVAEDLGVKPEGKLDMILDGGSCEFGIESTMASASASMLSSCASLRLDRIVSVSSRMVQFFSFENSARIRPPAVGAQVPFSTRAIVRFWTLWCTMSCTRFSMLTKMPAL